jgi:hypothetical protein
LLRTGTRLAPDTSGLGPFTELEKTKAIGFLAYGQLAMKCPVSWQLKHTLELLLLLLLAVTWLVWGLHGILVVVWFELGSGALRACGLGLGSILHGGLEPRHGVTEASLPLGTLLLLSLCSMNLRLFSFFSSALALSVRMAMFIRVLKSG